MKLIATIVLLASIGAFAAHRKIKVIAYPYIPDLNEDSLAGLKDWLEDQFFADTGRRIDILFDLVTYATDTYDPDNVAAALGPSGGYDMQEIDTIILGNLLQRNVLQMIPNSVSYDDYPRQVLKAVEDVYGNKWGHPSYTCTNVYYSYRNGIRGLDSFDEFKEWVVDAHLKDIQHHRPQAQLNWTGDLSSEPDLRLEYLDGWKDSHPSTPFYPSGYDYHTSGIDMNVINNLVYLRDACHDIPNHDNNCVDTDYYYDPNLWFGDFVNGKSLVLQGFPEYTSDILKLANADPNNPTRIHNVGPAVVGNGNKPFLFTDAWVISRTNCDNDCQSTAQIFLSWQRKHWAPQISLGLDLVPVRPRFLAVAWEPFYTSDEVGDLPDFAQKYYAFFNHEINRAVSLDTTHFWDNEASQSATIESLVTVGYTP